MLDNSTPVCTCNSDYPSTRNQVRAQRLNYRAALIFGFISAISFNEAAANDCPLQNTAAEGEPARVTLFDSRAQRDHYTLAIPRAYVEHGFLQPRGRRSPGFSLTISYPSGCPFVPPKTGRKRVSISDIPDEANEKAVRMRLFLSGTTASSQFDQRYLTRLQSQYIEMEEQVHGLRRLVSERCIGKRTKEGLTESERCIRREYFIGEKGNGEPRIFLECVKACIAKTRYRGAMLEYFVSRSLLPDWRTVDSFVRKFIDSLHVDATLTK